MFNLLQGLIGMGGIGAGGGGGGMIPGVLVNTMTSLAKSGSTAKKAGTKQAGQPPDKALNFPMTILKKGPLAIPSIIGNIKEQRAREEEERQRKLQQSREQVSSVKNVQQPGLQPAQPVGGAVGGPSLPLPSQPMVMAPPVQPVVPPQQQLQLQEPPNTQLQPPSSLKVAPAVGPSLKMGGPLDPQTPKLVAPKTQPGNPDDDNWWLYQLLMRNNNGQ